MSLRSCFRAGNRPVLLLLYQHHMVIVTKLSNVFASNLSNQGAVDDLRKLLILTVFE